MRPLKGMDQSYVVLSKSQSLLGRRSLFLLSFEQEQVHELEHRKRKQYPVGNNESKKITMMVVIMMVMTMVMTMAPASRSLDCMGPVVLMRAIEVVSLVKKI